MKILMATMSMGLGGAETHVLELSRALAARGHEVFVASAGGVFVRELETCGVKHETVPLDSRSPADAARAYARLSRIIEREGFDIVHAHARIPAFICGKLKEKYGFAFITTAHFDFRVDPLLAKITDWGEHVLAVSEDIAESVAKKYGYPRENISLINNGIDTSRFTPENGGGTVRACLGITESEKVIMYLGRLDEDSFLPAQVLIEAAEEICKSCACARIVIVGDGEKRSFLCRAAREANEKLGREAVLLPGGTAEAAEHIAACDVFAGPSRSAMEALASGKPTVVAGTFGMLGAFSPEIENEALRTNFCCRGSALPTAQRVAAEVLFLLSLGEEEKRKTAAYGREFIEKHYSVRAMADACEGAYKALLSERGKKAVICGYYGCGNIGDEAMLGAIVRALRKSGNVQKISVMSASPEKTAKRFGVCAVPRYNLQKVKKAFAESDVMIFGGGNILQDKTSTKSLIYYTHAALLAVRHACRVAVCANGIGPILREKNMAYVKKTLACAEYISMRDAYSRALAAELCAGKNVFSSGDLAFSCEAEGVCAPKELAALKYYAVFPKTVRGASRKALIAFFCKMKREHGLIPVFAAMHGREDEPLCRAMLAALPWARFYRARNERDILSLLKGSEFSLCMRFHAAVFSVIAECPFIALSDDTKLSAFFEGEELAACAFPCADASARELCSAAEEIIERREESARALCYAAREQRRRAEAELERLCALFA